MFKLEYITPCKDSKYINKLNVNRSTGIDGIGPKNNGQGIFPDKLHKGGDINDPHNYRPIYILPTLSKVLGENI